MTVPRAWLTAGILLAALTACAGDPEPPPPPPTSTTSTPETTTFVPPPGVPRVENPLEADSFAEDPCTSLTATQRKSLKLDDGGGEGDLNGPVGSTTNCLYAAPDPASGLVVSLSYYPGIPNGISYRYELHARYKWPVWKPTEIDGYPAVFWKNADDPTLCELAVGVTDTLSFNVRLYYLGWEGYTNQDTCAMAQDVATAVISTIKAAN